MSVDTPYGPPSDPVTVAELSGTGQSPSSPGTAVTTAFRPTASRTAPTCGRCARWAYVRSSRPAPSAGCVPSSAPARSSCPTSSSTARAVACRRSTTRARCTSRSPTRTAPTAARRRSTPRRTNGIATTNAGTMVVVEGPRFSTRAESRWYTAIGGAVVNMTGHPEAVLARELALCYTDDRAGHRPGRGRRGRPRRDPGGGVPGLRREHRAAARPAAWTPSPRCRDSDRDCPCPHALDGIELPITLPE